jgi:hypothetical protein
VVSSKEALVAHVVSLTVGGSIGDRALRHDLNHWCELSDGWQLLAATFDPEVSPTVLRLDVRYSWTSRREVRRFVLRDQAPKESIWERVC